MKDTFKLQYPFTAPSGQRIEELQLTRLKVKDMRAARRISDKPEEWDEPLLAAMTGLVPEDLAEMDLADYQALQKRFQHMLGLGGESAATVAGDGATGTVV
ncbi:TPA: phage tail assembly protein [Salmonella enterica]|nr:phage tail assembly protein [Salmonella enterica]